MKSEQITKYSQSALTDIMGWMIHDIWLFIEKDDFPSQLRKHDNRFKSRLLEIDNISKELHKLREVNKDSSIYSSLLDADTCLMLKKAHQLKEINIKSLMIDQIRECYSENIIDEEQKWLKKIKPYLSNKSPRFIEHKLNSNLLDWYKKHLSVLTFFEEASSKDTYLAIDDLVTTSLILKDLIDDQMQELHYLEFTGDQLQKDMFDLNETRTKQYLANDFNLTTEHLLSIRKYFIFLTDGYTKISFGEFMDRVIKIEDLFETWHSIGIASAQRKFELIQKEPYPEIDFFTLDQKKIEEYKKPKNWYFDIDKKVAVEA